MSQNACILKLTVVLLCLYLSWWTTVSFAGVETALSGFTKEKLIFFTSCKYHGYLKTLRDGLNNWGGTKGNYFIVQSSHYFEHFWGRLTWKFLSKNFSGLSYVLKNLTHLALQWTLKSIFLSWKNSFIIKLNH